MYVKQICVVLFFSFFTTITTKMIQPSLDPDNMNANINMKRYDYGEVKTNEDPYEWSEWSACSQTCGEGHRQRSCKVDWSQCKGRRHCACGQAGTCNLGSCDPYEWSEWSACSQTCGEGHRQRSCKVDWSQCKSGRHCSCGEAGTCNLGSCDPYEWSEWSACSQTCGEGHRLRYCKVDWSQCPSGMHCSCGQAGTCNLGSCGSLEENGGNDIAGCDYGKCSDTSTKKKERRQGFPHTWIWF